MSLDKLKERLLFNNVLDTWIALCQERGWEWFNPNSFKAFTDYLLAEKVSMKHLAVCVEEEGGRKAEFAQKYSSISGSPLQTTVLKLDNVTVSKIRSFKNAFHRND